VLPRNHQWPTRLVPAPINGYRPLGRDRHAHDLPHRSIGVQRDDDSGPGIGLVLRHEAQFQRDAPRLWGPRNQPLPGRRGRHGLGGVGAEVEAVIHFTMWRAGEKVPAKPS
jgi:hypothetical protein